MFKEIFLFELKYRIKRPATWAYFGILFIFGFFIGISGDAPTSEKVLANSPHAIASMLVMFSIFGTMIASAIMGVPIYRDIEHGVRNYYFTYPIGEKSYLLGRYFGSMLILFMVSMGFHCGLVLGFGLGPLAGFAEPDRFGPFSLWSYVHPTLAYYWPNFIMTGTIFFALVVFTRKIFAAYVGGILFFILYLVGLALTSDLEMKNLVDLLDPYGLTTFDNAVRYHTPVEQNAETVALSGNLLWNRLIWLSFSLILFFATLFRFNFTRFFEERTKPKAAAKEDTPAPSPRAFASLASISKQFSTGIYFRQMFSLASLEFRNIIRDRYFLAMLIGGVIFLFLDGWFGNTTYGTPALPTTYAMLEAKSNNFIVFVFVILIFYTGEVVHRDRSVKYNQIADALPVPNWMVYGSKILALAGVAFLLVNLVIVCGVLNQVLKGYFNFEFGRYFADLYLIEFPGYLQLMMLAFFVHILINKKFLGHVVSIAIWVLMIGLQAFGDYDYNLFFYSFLPNYLLSDMNGFGHFWEPLISFNIYWTALGVLLLIIGNLLWNRSTESGFSTRLKVARQRLTGASLFSMGAMAVLWIGMGAFIYNNVSVINNYQTSKEQEELTAAYEKDYRQYLGVPQPKLVDLKLAIDIFPEERTANVQGNFTIVNKTDEVIDSLHLLFASPIYHTQLSAFTFNGKEPKRVFADEAQRYYIYHFPDGPMQAGDTLEMKMTIDAGYQGFTNSGYNRQIVGNGTFFDVSIFPGFGYDPNGEMTSDSDRKKYDLPPKDYGLPAMDDHHGLSHLLFTDDANWVTFEATVSTAPDQIAVAPGYLQKEWEAEGRRYFHYKMDTEMLAFFNVSSARYAVYKDTWDNPDGSTGNIEIFHHPSHDYNVERYSQAVKKSMEYFTENFSPFQFRQMRILEFPRYASFAQSFPNTVPYAESFGWIGDFSDPDNTDYAYTVTAHEVAHQWWGHQISPSATRGANQISESMAEYASLMVMKEAYGPEAMQNFLQYELDRYLRGRANESKFEKTLLDNDDQAYVWYRKGGLVLYALADYISEDSLNLGFRQFLDSAAFKKEPPFVNTLDWYGFIKGVTPNSLQYFLKDNFEQICLYENRAKTAKMEKLADGRYEVSLEVDSKKIYYDGLGKELSTGEAENLIEIGIFAANGKNDLGMTTKTPLLLEKVWLKPGTQTLKFIVDDQPLKAGIDPYNKLIDRIPDDNLIAIE